VREYDCGERDDMIRYITRNNKVLAITRVRDRVYMGIGTDNTTAYEDLVKHMNLNKFAAYDFSLPTSAHNSSVRTRV
jgi:anaerobic selenocysteine-containing dehydrogenase